MQCGQCIAVATIVRVAKRKGFVDDVLLNTELLKRESIPDTRTTHCCTAGRLFTLALIFPLVCFRLCTVTTLPFFGILRLMLN